MTDQPSILLDTCALIFVANEERISEQAEAEISEAAYDDRLYVSPMSAWEIGIGVAKNRLKLPLGPLEFFQRFLRLMQAQLTAVSPEILIGSSNLPGRLHDDPMDRILISTARNLDMVLVTRDEPILDYGLEGNLRTLAC
ncbi:type II toxin-antitoxin system VapC family toxin [Mesorhizobium sp. B2-4-11]|uniref:type II toxin-antitoxin system VapC family toxin n=1 Tax=Mesorhizobium sp. B2-4-11 TaxID=2589938 RepID=UPI00112994BE|nr:type II toxin-antitoxin system VapC family toxin [Mesorhizobium sp. B2-4-11]TPL07737.1 type II toxin-antitoxin system VapC family toxin [Mesorhizobium sp. B2-4-11]